MLDAPRAALSSFSAAATSASTPGSRSHHVSHSRRLAHHEASRVPKPQVREQRLARKSSPPSAWHSCPLPKAAVQTSLATELPGDDTSPVCLWARWQICLGRRKPKVCLSPAVLGGRGFCARKKALRMHFYGAVHQSRQP